jgi:chemotaxis protein MotB
MMRAAYRILTLGFSGAMAFSLVGCTAPAENSDMEFELQRLSQENTQLERQLNTSNARSTVLAQQIESEQRDWNLRRAEVNRLRAQVDDLKRANTKLAQLQEELQAQLNKPLERPQISASPLPAEIDRALYALAAGAPDRVWYDRGRGALSYANDQLFALGSDEIRADALPSMHDLAAVLTTLPENYEIILVGHTDDVPIRKPETKAVHPTNWHLSVHRAIAVQKVLTKAGVPAARMGVMGYGQFRPVSNERAKNRRVEIFIVPEGGIKAFKPVTDR